jgi:cell division protein ZapA (FtsZ GTPase activity inhibitor)|nr:MAG: hypothetical protein KatS3mg041_0565 [Bacteroidota bacterium]
MELVSVRIQILDREYTFQVPPARQWEFSQAAEEIDQRMREFRTQRPGLSDTLYAIMAALYLALELRFCQQQSQVAEETWRAALREVADFLDRIAHEAPPADAAPARRRRPKKSAGS